MNRAPGSKAPLRPKELVAALDDLDRLAHDRPELTDASRALAACLGAAFAFPSDESSQYGPSDDRRRGVVAAAIAGTPYFRVERPALDREALNRRAAAICDALGAGTALSPRNAAAGQLRAVLRRDPAWLETLALLVLDDRAEAVALSAQAAGLEEGLVGSVLRLAMLPALGPCSASIAPCRPEGSWRRGDCPNCASRPILAESLGLEGRWSLRCGLCAAGWPTPRLGCPFCGRDDPGILEARFVEGEESHQRRVDCAACGESIKVISTLAPLSTPGLLVRELATVHLDLCA